MRTVYKGEVIELFLIVAGPRRPQLKRLLNVLHNPLSILNRSHASFNVAKTDPLIIRCSVVAVCDICHARQYSQPDSKVQLNETHLIRMHLCNRLHIHYLYLTRHHQISHSYLTPSSERPKHRIQTRKQRS